jgi:hypothetical protein
MDNLLENYRRAAFADYDTTGQMQLKNKFSTTCRLFFNTYADG